MFNFMSGISAMYVLDVLVKFDIFGHLLATCHINIDPHKLPFSASTNSSMLVASFSLFPSRCVPPLWPSMAFPGYLVVDTPCYR